MKNINVLIVEDENDIANIIKDYLSVHQFDSHIVRTGHEAILYLQESAPDFVILDLSLPDCDGIEICRKIREHSNVAILILSARGSDTDKVLGLGFGADDYMTKPFRPLELVARVKAQLRRYKKYNSVQTNTTEESIIVHSGLFLNSSTHECLLNEKPLDLTPTEFSILRILLERKGKVVSAEDLFREIWKDEYYTKSNNTITVHIRHLREKMGDTVENPQYIKTIWGVGYKIEL